MIDAHRAEDRRHAAAAPAMAGASLRRASASLTVRTRLAARLMAGGYSASVQKNVPAVQIGANAGDAKRADARGNPRRMEWRRARKAYPRVT